MTTHVGWIFLAIMRLNPTDDAPTQARYLDIATDIAEVAPTRGDATMLLGMASLESGFRWEVDGPECQSWYIRQRKCDDGRARSLWQVHRLPLLPRREQAAEALRQMKGSLAACGDLTQYASGQCGKGKTAADKRLTLIRRIERWQH